MSWIDRIRDVFQRRAQSDIVTAITQTWQANRPLPLPTNVKAFSEDGYKRNVIIFACVTERASSISEPQLTAYQLQKDGIKQLLPLDHELSKLLRRPTEKQTGQMLVEILQTHLDVAGNAYLFKRRNAFGMPLALRLMRPDITRAIPDINGEVISYKYGLPGNEQTLDAEDVIHFKGSPDPLDPFYGLSPILVLARHGDLDNSAVDYLLAFFLNAGAPAGILKHKMRVPAEERERIRQAFKERYGGPFKGGKSSGGWHDLMVIDADVEYQEIGKDPRRLDLGTVFAETETRICSAFGIPPIIIAAKVGLDKSTYSNYEQARKSVYQETYSPQWIKLESQFTLELAAEYGDDIVIEFEKSGIDALQEDIAEARKFALDGWERGMITRAEARLLAGYPAGVGDDVYKLKTTDLLSSDEDIPVDLSHTGGDLFGDLGPEERFANNKTLPPGWKLIHNAVDKEEPKIKKKL